MQPQRDPNAECNIVYQTNVSQTQPQRKINVSAFIYQHAGVYKFPTQTQRKPNANIYKQHSVITIAFFYWNVLVSHCGCYFMSLPTHSVIRA